MKDPRPMLNRIGKHLTSLSDIKIGIAMTALVFAVFFADFQVIDQLALKLYDLNFRLREPVGGAKDVVVVAIDQKSQEKLGRWPWTRSVMAELIDKIAKHQPKAVGLDIVFSYPEDRPDRLLAEKALTMLPRGGAAYKLMDEARNGADTDGTLAAAMRNAGNVACGYYFFTQEEEVRSLALDNDQGFRLIRNARFPAVKYPPGGKREYDLIRAVGVMPNIKPITDAAKYSGYFNMIPDADGTLRTMTNVIELNGKYFPPLSFQLLREWYADEAPKIEFKEYGVTGFYVGDRFIPSNEYGQTMINYYGGPEVFTTISVADIMAADPADERIGALIRGKIVIVGATATGIYDLRTTPAGLMPGVYIHATFVQNVIDGKILNKANWFFIFDALSILLLGSFLTLSMRRLKVLRGGLVALALITAYIYFQRYMFLHQSAVLDIIYPAMTIVLVYGGIAVYQYFVESREKQYVKKAFEFYLSPVVISKIMEDPGKLKLGGETQMLTACFSDIKDFSKFSEQLAPPQLVELLNEYLTEMTDIIMANEGTLDKYIGDAIVSFFGAPLHYENHAAKACAATILCQKKLAEMREKWKAEGRPAVEARFGVNTGQMLVGNMGSHQRFDYTVMGDEVNLAARLESVNKQYGTYICISESTYLAIGGQFEVRELDVIRVVGRETPVKIFELIDFKGALSPVQVEWLEAYAYAYNFYREREFEKALEAFEAVMKIKKDDTASWRFVTRCRTFINNPPEPDWDGVYNLTSK